MKITVKSHKRKLRSGKMHPGEIGWEVIVLRKGIESNDYKSLMVKGVNDYDKNVNSQ